MKILYNAKRTEYARQLRNNSTKAEIKLWNLLKAKQLRGYDFHRQKPLSDFIADFYCFRLRLVIEVDAATHAEEEVQRKDRIEEKQLSDMGLAVLRFSDEQVMNKADTVIRTIEKYIDECEGMCKKEKYK